MSNLSVIINFVGIYKITSPTGRVYIGKTYNLKLRLKKYKNLQCKKQPRLYNSLVKYGWDSHIFEIIEECEINNLNCRERYWQDFYDVLDDDKGLNCILQKDEEKSGLLSQETKNKIGEGNKGKTRTEEDKQKMSEAHSGEKHYNYGKTLSEEHKNKISQSKMGKQVKEENPFYGKKHTEETRKILSQKSKTKTLNPENIIKFSNWVVDNKEYLKSLSSVLVLDTQTGVFYNSIVEASFYIGMHPCTLRDQLRGVYKNKTNLILA